MALPRILKLMDVHIDGGRWLGEVTAFTRPKLGRQMEEYRGAFDRPVDLDLGGTKLECEFKTAGHSVGLATKVGQVLIDGNAVRFSGAYQRDDGGWTNTEIYVRGRIAELDSGEDKVGEVGEETTKMSLTYYRQVEDGRTAIEIDVLNHVHRVNGIDLLAEARRMIGL